MKRGFEYARARRRVAGFLHFDVRSDAAATIKHAPRGCLHWWSCVRMRRRRCEGKWRLEIVWPIGSGWRSLVICWLVSRVVIVKRAARIIALQRTTVRCVVTRGRERQSGVEGQLENSLHQAFAETRLTDNQSAAVILNRAGHDFRG